MNDQTHQGTFNETVRQCEPPVGIAGALLENRQVRDFLDSVQHLGSLSDLVEIRASRLDYVRLWIDVLTKIKNMHPGLGLGSHHSSKAKGISLTKLEMLHVWVVVANCGHLFHTFSTERALLYILSKNPDERRKFMGFLGPLDEKFQAVKDGCAAAVNKNNYMTFFYVLATWRLFAGDMKNIRGVDCDKVKVAWSSFFETRASKEHSAQMLQWLFRKSRQIATAHIHSVMQIGPSVTVSISQLLADMTYGGSVVGYSKEMAPTDVSRHLEDLESLHLKVFFSSPDANRLALKDMRACKRWWEERRSSSVEDRVLELFCNPSDWPKEDTSQIPHFCRLYLPAVRPQEMWLLEVERWKNLGWTSGEYVISTNGTSSLTCDVYMEDSRLDLGALSRAAGVMAAKFYERHSYERESIVRDLRHRWRSLECECSRAPSMKMGSSTSAPRHLLMMEVAA